MVKQTETSRGVSEPLSGGRKALLVAAGSVAVSSIVYLVSSLGGGVERPDLLAREQISLDEPEASGDARVEPSDGGLNPLVVAIAPVISPEKSLEMYRGLVEYLAEKTGRAPVLMQRRS